MLQTLDTRGKLFLSLSALFVSALLVGDLIGGKLFEANLLGFTVRYSVGIIPFPLTFLLTDLLNEFYGKRAARVVTWVGFGMALFTFAIVTLAVALPWDPVTLGARLERHHAAGLRHRLRRRPAHPRGLDGGVPGGAVHGHRGVREGEALTGGRLLWLRATGSTLVSQLIDTTLIQTLAWAGTLPWPRWAA